MKHSFARGGFGYVGLGLTVVIVAILAVLVVLLVNSRTKPTKTPEVPLWTKFNNVESADKLATLGKAACPVMLEVLEHSDNEEVKIACMQGLARNKYFDAGPALLKILAADDDQITLCYQAYLALTKLMPESLPMPRDPAERRKWAEQKLAGWDGKKKNMEAKTASPRKVIRGGVT